MMFNNSLFVYGDQNVEVPAHLSFGKYMLNRLRCKSDEIAVVNASTNASITYKEFTKYAVSLSASLAELGVKRGETVGIGSEKRVTFIPTTLAVVFAGATYTPYDLKSGRDVFLNMHNSGVNRRFNQLGILGTLEVLYRCSGYPSSDFTTSIPCNNPILFVSAALKHKLDLTKPKYFVCSSLFWKTYRDILRDLKCIKTFICFDENEDIELSIPTLIARQSDADVTSFEPAPVQGQTDTALILYSSGTTGMPKGVQLTHLNCILNSLPEDFKDECLQTAFIFGEWYHNYDTFMTYKFLSAGRKIVFVDTVTPVNLLRSFQDYKINIAMLVPSLVGYLSKAEEVDKYDLSSLKIIYCRSSPLHRKTIEAIKKRFPNLKNVLQGYGMTESGELTSESWGTKGPKIGSVGMASPGIELMIVDPETKEILGPKQRGEICLRGPVFMKGYIDIDPSKYLDDQGFFLTGDLGYYDEDNYFYIVDRLKEIISYDGYKVAPLELETILQLHPAVREAGVVGRPAGDMGEEPTAFVVRQPGATVSDHELQQYVAAEVPDYMQLRGGVLFVPELPRNPRGKVLRRRLREMLQTAETPS